MTEKIHPRLGDDLIVGIGIGIGIEWLSGLDGPDLIDTDADTDPGKSFVVSRRIPNE